ncbi:ankyrin repeat domain-containing protein [Tumidithrix helvetica PCC 7403]|uniref:ankyrin repeat domain-containing protein n=1 Tax=Tumidithrix helvetica TaxID=3457545 RepID=UPI003CB1E548
MNQKSPFPLTVSLLTGMAIAAISLPHLSNASPKPIQTHPSLTLPTLKQSNLGKVLISRQDQILLQAIRVGDLASVKMALSAKANPNAPDENGETALMIAASNNHIEIVKLLLTYGANVNGGSYQAGYPLMAAAREGHIEIVRLFLRKGAKVNLAADEGFTALDEAIEENRVDVVKLLLESGANPNHYVSGSTPLYDAASNGYVKIVSLLIKHGADINAKSFGSRTPLAIAIQYKHLEVVDLLRKAGAR